MTGQGMLPDGKLTCSSDEMTVYFQFGANKSQLLQYYSNISVYPGNSDNKTLIFKARSDFYCCAGGFKCQRPPPPHQPATRLCSGEQNMNASSSCINNN